MVFSSSPSANTTLCFLFLILDLIGSNIDAIGLVLPSNSLLYISIFLIGFLATPLSIAAFATADETKDISLGSNGAGIM